MRGLLHDLAQSGLVFASGNGNASAYRVATQDELGALRSADQSAGLDALAWVPTTATVP